MNFNMHSILKSGLLTSIFFMLSASLQARVIVSDFDDTVKITEVKTANAIWNVIVEQSVFTGMPELLMELKKHEEDSKLTLVSGSPKFIKLLVEDLLYLHKIDHDDLILLGSGAKKPQALKIIAKSSNQKIILIGDDQENDPKFYTDLRREFSDQVEAVYIHRLNNSSNKPLHSGVIPYFTAYEVALHEAAQGRLSLDALERVRAATMKKMDESRYDTELRRRAADELFPRWAKCETKDIQTILKPWLNSDLADKRTIQSLMDLATTRCKSTHSAKPTVLEAEMQIPVTWESL